MATAKIEAGVGNIPHYSEFLVYINGLRVPASDVSVNMGVWQIPEASITLPAHPLLQRLGADDRVEVAIFYLDVFYDPASPKYRLLFDGEIIGWSYSTGSGNRDISFTAVMDIQMWTQLFYFFLNNVDTAVESVTAPNGDSVVAAGALYPAALFMFGPFNQGGSKADIKRPYDILRNVMRGILSSNQPPTRRSIPAINFFARWARKRNFVNRMAALPYLEDIVDGVPTVFPVLQAVQQQQILDTVGGPLAQGVGNAGSLFDVVQRVFSTMFYELGMLPTAPCVRVQLGDGKIIGTADTETADHIANPLRLLNYVAKPQAFFAIPPMCNVFFPSMMESISFNESYHLQPTRLYVNDEFYGSKLRSTAGNENITAAALTVAWPPQAHAAHQAKLGKDPVIPKGSPIATGKNILIFPDELFRGPCITRMPVPRWFALVQNARAADANKAGMSDGAGYAETQKMYQLYAQYEFHRSRLEKRNASGSSTFQPYAVPGYPCVVFDKRSSAFDLIGYLMNVSHSMSVRNGGRKSTSFNVSFSRTIPEFMEIVRKEAVRLNAVIGSGPVDPIDLLRDQFQDFASAEQFYSKALHAGSNDGPASFDFREVLSFEKRDDTKALYAEDVSDYEKIVLTGDPITGLKFLDPTIAKTSKLTENLHTNRLQPIVPSPEYSPLFESHDMAMEAIARPICTLDEYVRFVHGEADLADLVSAGQVVVQEDSDDGEISPNGNYASYSRIFKRRPLADDAVEPPLESLGAKVNDDTSVDGGVSTFFEAGFKPLPADYPETRRDWDTILEAYVEQMLRGPPHS